MIYFKIISEELRVFGNSTTFRAILSSVYDKNDINYEELNERELEKYADVILTESEWASYNCLARLEGGKIVFGPTTESLAACIRAQRTTLLRSYDLAINQLTREERLAEDENSHSAILDLITQWDIYARKLCALPEQEGFPWDGGGELTPWPEQPKLTLE